MNDFRDLRTIPFTHYFLFTFTDDARSYKTESIPFPNDCVKSVRIQSFSGPYLVRMRGNTDQKNSECGNFSQSDINLYKLLFSIM